MKSKLDKIEQKLQYFFESTAHKFPWGDEWSMLAHRLVQAMQTSMSENEKGEIILPYIFNISLSPKIFASWGNDVQMLAGMSTSFQEAAVEAGIFFASKPVIQIEADKSLGDSDVMVLAIHAKEKGTSTAIVTHEKNAGTEARREAPLEACLILSNGKHFALDKSVINIGRRRTNYLIINDLHVSREHAQIRFFQDHFMIFDLNTTGGTYVNGRKITQTQLFPGDVISLAGHTLIYVEELNHTRSPGADTTLSSTTKMDIDTNQSQA